MKNEPRMPARYPPIDRTSRRFISAVGAPTTTTQSSGFSRVKPVKTSSPSSVCVTPTPSEPARWSSCASSGIGLPPTVPDWSTERATRTSAPSKTAITQPGGSRCDFSTSTMRSGTTAAVIT